MCTIDWCYHNVVSQLEILKMIITFTDLTITPPTFQCAVWKQWEWMRLIRMQIYSVFIFFRRLKAKERTLFPRKKTQEDSDTERQSMMASTSKLLYKLGTVPGASPHLGLCEIKEKRGSPFILEVFTRRLPLCVCL